jgi:adenylate cyclase class IV
MLTKKKVEGLGKFVHIEVTVREIQNFGGVNENV